MLQRLLAFALFSSFLTQLSAIEDKSIRKAMIQDLESVKYTFSFRYAPSEWKKERYGWDLEDAFLEAKNKISSKRITSSKEYQKVFKSFLHTMRDYHVKGLFYSSEWSYFPFNVRGSMGRYYLTGFRRGLPGDFYDTLIRIGLSDDTRERLENLERDALLKINGEVGNEIVTINGQPVAHVVEEFIDEELGGDRTDTGYALAEKMLFHRMGKYAQKVPTGDFTVTFRCQRTGKLNSYTLPWLHFPELIKNRMQVDPLESSEGKSTLFADLCVEFAKDLQGFESKLNKMVDAALPVHLNETVQDRREKGFLPPLGPIVWEHRDENPYALYAYEYLNSQKRRIGYLRINDFIGQGQAPKKRIEEMIAILKHIEANCEGIVVDITDNPGGVGGYLYAVLSLFADRPLVTPLQNEVLTQELVFRTAACRGATLYNLYVLLHNKKINEGPYPGYHIEAGYCLNEESMRQQLAYYDALIDEWNLGKKRSDLHNLFGIDTVNPHPGFTFKKPLLLLVDELDFSCADWFPAILQDNGRATVFGNKTAGAGGYVLRQNVCSRFGVSKYSFTGSFPYRPTGAPIENLGVTPDIPYKLTENDLKFNYRDYIEAVNAEMQKIIKK